LNVRVVKGQWPDADEAGTDPSAGFLSVIDRLAGRARHVAVATHDPKLSREALKRLRGAGTSCELELLFGLPMRPSLRAAADADVAVRVYTPYGQAWLPYQIAQASRQPRVLWWAVRDLLLGPWAGHARLRALGWYAQPATLRTGAPSAGQLH
jgi:proline dehydrogenase